MAGIIAYVEPDSIAEDLGWKPGDKIISINGHELHDLIDYRFYITEEIIKAAVQHRNEVIEYEFEKDWDMSLGVEFTDALFDGIHTCGAHCIFCFVEQLPKGLRKSLYLKDDDYRLSFIHGNYVTLANVTDEELDRIITQRLSPLYVSVHTTNLQLREKLIGRKSPDILQQIDKLAEGHISLQTQIVLCRGVNDGEYLDKTIADLAIRYPTVESIAIVPAGLSKYRKNKTPIGTVDAQYSADILNKVKHWQREFMKKYGTRLVWAADEFYLSAGRPVPVSQAYEGFLQIENGIGLVRKFKDSARRAKRILSNLTNVSYTVSAVTGTLAAPLVRDWADSVTTGRLKINVYPIVNELFGETVTVTGLISGKDIIAQLKGKELGNALLIPSVALRDDTFLDDITTDQVASELGVKVEVVEPRPYQIAKRIAEMVS